MSDLLYPNGLQGDRGYLFEPTSSEALGARLRGKDQPVADKSWLTSILQKFRSPYQGLPFGVDSKDVSRAGWAIVFNEQAPPAVREAIQPLIDHRRGKISPDRCKVLEYKTGQGVQDFLKSYEVFPGSVIPEKVPYYLLLVGDPTEIPFDFQCMLDIEYAVGRLSFEEPEQYHRYATSLIEYETGQQAIPNSRQVAYWGVRHDPATELSADYLISPLYGDASPDAVAQAEKYQSKCLLAGEATKSNLLGLFKDQPPAMLCTASHGLGWKMQHADRARQLRENGALCSQDWCGEGAPKMEHYVLAEDITDDLNVHGTVAFMFACFGAGTPAENHFLGAGKQIEKIAEKPFVSAIPQRLLGHPNGGALAVFGHVDMAWSYAFKPPKVGEQLQPFQNLIRRIISGEPIGHSTKDFSERYSLHSAELLGHFDHSQQKKPISDKKLARLWIQRNDAQNYIMLGDPAAQIRVDKLADTHATNGKSAKQSDPVPVAVNSGSRVGELRESPPPQDSKQAECSDPERRQPSERSVEPASREGAELGEVAQYQAAPQPQPIQRDGRHASVTATEAMKLFLGTLRSLRVQAQHLLEPIQACKNIDRTADDAVAQVEEAIQAASSTYTATLDDVGELRASLYELSRKDAEICDWCSDEVTHLENHWTQVDRNWPQPDTPANQVQSLLVQVEEDLHEIVRRCGQLTIPGRVEDHLHALRIGQAFDFHKGFQDELPEEDDRKQVLQYMANHPYVVSGVIDAESGLIFRASRKWIRRVFSLLMVISLALAGFAVLAALDQLGFLGTETPVSAQEVQDEPARSWTFRELSLAYALLFFGAVGHGLVGALKQSRQRASKGLLVMEEWLLWFHVRETSLVLTVVYLWIGLIGLAFLVDPNTAWTTAFFVGYSIDSFVDLFLQKFSSHAGMNSSPIRSAM